MLVEAPFTHLHAAPVLQPLPGVPAGVTAIRGPGAAHTVRVALTWHRGNTQRGKTAAVLAARKEQNNATSKSK